MLSVSRQRGGDDMLYALGTLLQIFSVIGAIVLLVGGFGMTVYMLIADMMTW